MKAIRARYEEGKLVWIDPPPKCERCEVLVIFPFEGEEEPLGRQIQSKGVSPSDLLRLAGLVEWGGDALEDERRLYNERTPPHHG